MHCNSKKLSNCIKKLQTEIFILYKKKIPVSRFYYYFLKSSVKLKHAQLYRKYKKYLVIPP